MPPEKDKDSGLSPEIARLSAQLARDPKSKLFIPLAEEYIKAGMVEEAVMTLEEGLKVHPAYMSARVLLGKAHLEKGDIDSACVQFEAVVKAIPDNLFAYKKLGEIYRSQGRRDDAMKAYRMITLLSPKDEEARQSLAALESGAMPVESSTPSAQETVVETHRAGETVKEAQKPTTPAAPEPPVQEEPAEEGPKVFDLTGFEEELPEEATALEALPEEIHQEEPDFLEMPVPEMETLESMRQAAPAEQTLSEEEALPVEEEPQSFSLDEDVPFALDTAPDEDVSDTSISDRLASDLEFGDMLSAEPEAGEEPELEPETEPVDEAAAAGYSVKLEDDGRLNDILSTINAEEVEEEVSTEVNRPVYEIQDDLTSVEIDGMKYRPGIAEAGVSPASPESPAENGTKEAFKTETLAELYITQGFYDRAINIYKDLLNERPDDLQLKQKLEDLYLLAGVSSAKAAAKAKLEEEQARQRYEPIDFDSPESDVVSFESLTPQAVPVEEAPVDFEAQLVEAEPEPEAVFMGVSQVLETLPDEEAPAYAVEVEPETPFTVVGRPGQGAPKGPVDEKAVERLEQFLDNIRRKYKQ